MLTPLFAFLPFLALLARHGEHALLDVDVHVLRLDAGQLEVDLELVVRFVDVHRRCPERPGLPAAAERVVEEPVDLASQAKDGSPSEHRTESHSAVCHVRFLPG